MSDWRKPCNAKASWQKPPSQSSRTMALPSAELQAVTSASDSWRFPCQPQVRRQQERVVGGGGGADWRFPCSRSSGPSAKRMEEQRRDRSKSRRRTGVTVDLHPIALGSHPSKLPDHKLTQYAKNGVNTERIKRLLLTGRCSCTRDCFRTVRATVVEKVCKFYWHLPPEEQAYLVPHPVSCQTCGGVGWECGSVAEAGWSISGHFCTTPQLSWHPCTTPRRRTSRRPRCCS